MVKLELELWELDGVVPINSLCHLSFSLSCLFLFQWQKRTRVKAEDSTENQRLEGKLNMKYFESLILQRWNTFPLETSQRGTTLMFGVIFPPDFSASSIPSSRWMSLGWTFPSGFTRALPDLGVFNSEMIKSLLEFPVTTHSWVIPSCELPKTPWRRAPEFYFHGDVLQPQLLCLCCCSGCCSPIFGALPHFSWWSQFPSPIGLGFFLLVLRAHSRAAIPFARFFQSCGAVPAAI